MSDYKENIKGKLAAERRVLLSFLESLSEGDWTCLTHNEPWTVRDLLAHLVGAEVSQQGLIRMWLGGNTAMHPEFDMDRWNAGQLRRREGRSCPQLLEDLVSAHQQTLNLLDSLSEQQLAIRGEHPFWGPETSIEQVMRGIYRHDRLHLDDMRQAVGR